MHVHYALAEIQCAAERLAQLPFGVRAHAQVRHRQLDGVLLEARQPRPLPGGQELAVDPQLREAFAGGPFREVGVVALAVHHQRRKETDVLAAIVAQQTRGHRLEALRLDRHVAAGAELGAELDVEQAQEVVKLGQGGHRALRPAAAGALLDSHRGRDAEDRVDVGTRRRLHELARIGVEGFEIAPLPLREQDVEREGTLAAAGHAGDDGELPARDVHVHALQVVLAGVVNADGALGARSRGPACGDATEERRAARREARGVVRLPLPSRHKVPLPLGESRVRARERQQTNRSLSLLGRGNRRKVPLPLRERVG